MLIAQHNCFYESPNTLHILYARIHACAAITMEARTLTFSLMKYIRAYQDQLQRVSQQLQHNQRVHDREQLELQQTVDELSDQCQALHHSLTDARAELSERQWQLQLLAQTVSALQAHHASTLQAAPTGSDIRMAGSIPRAVQPEASSDSDVIPAAGQSIPAPRSAAGRVSQRPAGTISAAAVADVVSDYDHHEPILGSGTPQPLGLRQPADPAAVVADFVRFAQDLSESDSEWDHKQHSDDQHALSHASSSSAAHHPSALPAVAGIHISTPADASVVAPVWHCPGCALLREHLRKRTADLSSLAEQKTQAVMTAKRCVVTACSIAFSIWYIAIESYCLVFSCIPVSGLRSI